MLGHIQAVKIIPSQGLLSLEQKVNKIKVNNKVSHLGTVIETVIELLLKAYAFFYYLNIYKFGLYTNIP